MLSISVIIPIYNAHSFVTELLDSLFYIKDKCYEIILVDDCSTDKTINLIKEHKIFEHIKLIKTDINSGPSTARNFGVKNSNGNYFLFLDSDVQIHKNTLFSAITYLSTNPECECLTGINSPLGQNKTLISKFHSLFSHYTLNLISEGGDASTWNPRIGLISKKLFTELNGFSEVFRGADIEDYEFSKKISSKTKIHFSKTVVVDHLFDNFFTSSRNFFRRSKMWIKLIFSAKKLDKTGHTRASNLPSLLVAAIFFASLLFLPFTKSYGITFGLLGLFFVLNIRAFLFFRSNIGSIKSTFYVLLVLYFTLIAEFGIFFGIVEIFFRKFFISVDRYYSLARSYIRKSSVSYLILYVTSRCDLKCTMCFYADSLNSPEGDGLTLNQLEIVSKSLPSLMQLTLTGGEPFIRKDLAKVIETFYKHSLTRNFTIPTNGTYTDRIIQCMSYVLPRFPSATFKIGISLDGPKDFHNAIRGSDKSYANLKNTFAQLKDLQKIYPNLIITMSGVISSFNLHVGKDLVNIFLEEFPCDDYTLQYARGETKDPNAKVFDALEYQKCVQYLEQKKANIKRNYNSFLTKFFVRQLTTRTRDIVSEIAINPTYVVNCVAGSRLAVLYHTGMLSPCEILHTWKHEKSIEAKYNGFYFGNIKDHGYDVQKTINTSLGASIQKYIRTTKCFCTFECAVIASIFYQPKELFLTLIGSKINKKNVQSKTIKIENNHKKVIPIYEHSNKD